MINFLGLPFRKLQARLSTKKLPLPTLALYSTNTSSESSEHLFSVGNGSPVDGDDDAASYGLRSPQMPTSPRNASRVPSADTDVEDGPGQPFEEEGIPLIALRSNDVAAHIRLSTDEASENVTLQLGIDFVKTLRDVLQGRREAAPLQQKLRGAESRINTSEDILEMKRQELLAHSTTMRSSDLDLETLIKVRQDVKVLDREVHEMTRYQEECVAERDEVTETLRNNAVYQDFLEARLFGVLDDAMVESNLLKPVDEVSKDCEKTSTTALSPLDSSSSFVSLEELAHRTDYHKDQLARQDLLEACRAAEDQVLTLQQLFDHREDREREQKQAFREAQANDKAGTMTTEDFDVRFLMGSMRLTADLKAAETARYEARDEAMAHGCLRNEPDQDSDFADDSSDGYADSAIEELIAEAPRDRIESWMEDSERQGLIEDEPRPIEDVYDTDEDDSLVLPEDSASVVAGGKRREMIDLYTRYSAAQWSPED